MSFQIISPKLQQPEGCIKQPDYLSLSDDDDIFSSDDEHCPWLLVDEQPTDSPFQYGVPTINFTLIHPQLHILIPKAICDKHKEGTKIFSPCLNPNPIENTNKKSETPIQSPVIIISPMVDSLQWFNTKDSNQAPQEHIESLDDLDLPDQYPNTNNMQYTTNCQIQQRINIHSGENDDEYMNKEEYIQNSNCDKGKMTKECIIDIAFREFEELRRYKDEETKVISIEKSSDNYNTINKLTLKYQIFSY